MTPQQEAAAERQFEKHFRSHRPPPPGRNVIIWEQRFQKGADDKYRKNFDNVFPNAPGAGI